MQRKGTVAKQADEAAKPNAAERLNAEMKAELRAATAAAERKRGTRDVGKQAAKDTVISRDLSQALWSFYEFYEYQLQDFAELQEVKQAVREYRAHISEMPAPVLATFFWNPFGLLVDGPPTSLTSCCP